MSKKIVCACFILLASTALSASLAACRQIPEGGPSSLPPPAASPTLPLAASPIPSPTSTPFTVPLDTPVPTPTPEPTTTPEQLGGTKVAYLESSELLHQPFPESLQQYLVPSSYEQWKTVGEYQVSDGTTVPWDARVILQRSDGMMFVLLPALIRGEVTIANPNQSAGGTITYVVYEFPAQDGSNFIIQSFRDGKLSTARSYAVVPLKGPIPVSWLQSSAGSPIPLTEFSETTSFTGYLTEKQYADNLAAHQGKMTLLMFPVGGNYVDFLQKIISSQMMGNGKISGIADALGMIEPAATP